MGGLFVVFWCRRHPARPDGDSGCAAADSFSTAFSGRAIDRRSGGRQSTPRSGFEPSWLVPPREPVRIRAADLKHLLELDRPLERLARLAATEESAHAAPSISLVICTRNRPERLEKCLSSIRGLSPRPQEVIVVDNDPASGLTRPVAERFPEVRYVQEPRPGLSAARNAGVLNCRGAIVAFTDDDVIVHPGWIGAIGAAFRDQDVIAVTGLVLPAELATRPSTSFRSANPRSGGDTAAIDFDRAFFASTKHLGARVWRLGAGANMAFRREAFERVGLFDERLGAGAAGCSEDSEMWYRLLAEGHRCRYTRQRRWCSTITARSGKTCADQTTVTCAATWPRLFFQFERYGHWGNIYRAFVALPWYSAESRVLVPRNVGLEGCSSTDRVRNGCRRRWRRRFWEPLPATDTTCGTACFGRTRLRHGAACATAHAWTRKHDDHAQESPAAHS